MERRFELLSRELRAMLNTEGTAGTPPYRRPPPIGDPPTLRTPRPGDPPTLGTPPHFGTLLKLCPPFCSLWGYLFPLGTPSC